MDSGEKEKLEFQLNAKQREYVDAQEREVLLFGGAGTGKSFTSILNLYMRASVPGAREGLARLINADIPNSFLKDWAERIPSHLYHVHKHEQRIEIFGGGEIQYFGCDDEKRLGSRQLTGCTVEEAAQMLPHLWTKINTIIRLPHPYGNRLYGACNPESPHHWLYSHFGIDSTAPKNRRWIRTTIYDGYPGLTKEYIEAMESLTGVARQRLLLGNWVEATGCIFDNFDEKRNVKSREAGGRCVLFVDDGESAPFVCLRAFTSNRRLHIADELYKRGWRSLERKADAIAKMMDDEVEAVVVDRQATPLIEALRIRGIPAVKSKKGAHSVEHGISRIRTLLEPSGATKEPRLTIDASCKDTIREFRTWAYTEGGEPHRDNNHALDALRYGIAYLHLGAEKPAAPVEEEQPAQSETPPSPETDEHLWQREVGVNLGIWG